MSNPYLSQAERRAASPLAEVLQQLAKGLRIRGSAVRARGPRTVALRGTVEAAVEADEGLNPGEEGPAGKPARTSGPEQTRARRPLRTSMSRHPPSKFPHEPPPTATHSRPLWRAPNDHPERATAPSSCETEEESPCPHS